MNRSSEAVDPPARAPRSRRRQLTRMLVAAGTAIAALGFSGCMGSNDAKFDISPIFPLSSNTCQKYHGTKEGSGFQEHCWVNQANCKQAASDWAAAMRSGGVNDAILFSCD